MLENQRVSGCEIGCWQAEDRGDPSRRQQVPQAQYHETRRSAPRVLNLVVNNTCSLTCSYCCKNFSSSWLRDVVVNGDYDLPGDRYRASEYDRVLSRLSQPQLDQSPLADMILDQIRNNLDDIQEVIITGGEPLLYAQLESIVEMFAGKDIVMFTSLGVPTARLKKMLPILERHGVRVKISAENTGAWHEFNRYGSSYREFRDNYELLRQCCTTEFWSVITNLTVINFAEFVSANVFADITIDFGFDPDFMHPANLDWATKDSVAGILEHHAPAFAQRIVPVMYQSAPDEQRQNLSKFLQRYTQSRKLTLDMFPESFKSWLNQDYGKKQIFIPIEVLNERTMD